MEATLTFRLPEEESEHRLAVNGAAWCLVSWEMDQWLRDQLKYGGRGLKTADEALQKAREQLLELIESRGISLEDIS